MRITTKPHKCIASGACVWAAPDLFDQDDNGTVQIKRPNPPSELHAAAREAARACPAAVIAIEDDDAESAAAR